MYKKGGKASKKKSSFMEESKEITFGNKPMKKGYGGLYSAAEKSENVSRLKKMHGMEGTKKKTGGADPGKPFKFKTPAERNQAKLAKVNKKIEDITANSKNLDSEEYLNKAASKISGVSESTLSDSYVKKLKGKKEKIENMMTPGRQTKKTGGKSMEPGGGGRFASMVAGLKKKGKSEDSAKSIAATIGRNKYGKKKFQEMAAKGKKGLGGMSDSTSSNDAGMEMMEESKKKTKKR